MSSYRITRDPRRLVGRVQSATQFVAMASLPLAPLLGGGLLAALGGHGALLVAGVLCGLVAMHAHPGPQSSGRCRSPAEWPTARSPRRPPGAGRGLTSGRQPAWIPASPAAPRAGSRPCTP